MTFRPIIDPSCSPVPKASSDALHVELTSPLTTQTYARAHGHTYGPLAMASDGSSGLLEAEVCMGRAAAERLCSHEHTLRRSSADTTSPSL